MNYAINFSCINKEEASGEVWPANRWNATIKAINTVFHLEFLLRIRNNSCPNGFLWQRCCNERICRTFKKLKKKGSLDLKQVVPGSGEFITFVSFFLLKSQASKHCMYNHKIIISYTIYHEVIFLKKKCCFLNHFHLMSF